MGDEASTEFNGYERGIVRGVVYPDHRIYQYHSSRLLWRSCKDRATRRGLAEAAKNGVNAGTRERDAPPSGPAVSQHFVELWRKRQGIGTSATVFSARVELPERAFLNRFGIG